VEVIELRNHPWFVASQFHPELKSRPTNPHPLFREFIAAAMRRHQTHPAGVVPTAEPAGVPGDRHNGHTGLPEPVHAGAAETKTADAPGA
jgi:hypothetical protein